MCDHAESGGSSRSIRNKKVKKGKRIVSEKWVEESTREHSRWKKHDLSYGYLWWVNEDGYAAMGDGGNIIYVNTKDKTSWPRIINVRRHWFYNDFSFTYGKGNQTLKEEMAYTPLDDSDKLKDIADENLFSPLEIHVDGDLMFKSKEEQLAFNESIDTSGWVRDSLGIHTAGWGLTLSPMDMAKIGQLYLNKGIWNGKRIVSEKWVEESVSPQPAV